MFLIQNMCIANAYEMAAGNDPSDGRNLFWDHFLKELRHQAQLGKQAF